MIRQLLPVTLCLALPTLGMTQGQTLSDDGVTPSDQTASDCDLRPGLPTSCVRVLACIGTEGVWFEGAAFGWDAGRVQGITSEAVTCEGTWRSGGFLGSGTALMTCQNDTMVEVIYYSQDPATGTAIGLGRDSTGRRIKAWSGLNVLEFLTPSGGLSAELPCTETPIPISAVLNAHKSHG